MGTAKPTLCPEDIVLDLVRLPNKLLEAQLSGKEKRNYNHEMDFKQKNREEKRNETFRRSYRQCDGPPLGGYLRSE